MELLLNRKMSNQELMAIPEVKEAIKAGNVVLIDKVETSNPEFINLYFFGSVTAENDNPINEVQAMFLGWNNEFQQRCIQNANIEVAANYEVGKVFENMGIQMHDAIEPSFETHTPRKNKEGEVLMIDGHPIYRTTVLNKKENIISEGHKLLKVSETITVDGEIKETPKGVSINKLLENTTV